MANIQKKTSNNYCCTESLPLDRCVAQNSDHFSISNEKISHFLPLRDLLRITASLRDQTNKLGFSIRGAFSSNVQTAWHSTLIHAPIFFRCSVGAYDRTADTLANCCVWPESVDGDQAARRLLVDVIAGSACCYNGSRLTQQQQQQQQQRGGTRSSQ